ncbi:MAG TPA: pepsin/retropepsin-like aspartic protease family protein [Verrucomicrobiae bacterium]|jgi:hypothetical protein|nr:pepsin/retropepsin-like aspartic protease family protein [Verrucomicrobiae bacterium]
MVRLCAAVLALCFLIPPAARADDAYTPTTLTAVEVLQKAGVARGELTAGTYAIVSRSHVGGLDQTHTTYTDGANVITHAVAGPFATAYGTYGQQDWDQDENGIVTLDTNFHERENPNARALDHPEDPANRVTMLGVTQTSPALYAIDVNPANGEHQILYYATDTFLLARSVTWEKDRLKHVATYDGYRRVFGSTRAFHTSYSDGRTDNDTDSKVVSFAPVKTAVDFHIPASRSILTFPSAQPFRLPVRFIDGTIIVRATVNGRGLDFQLDTGSSGMTINPDVAHDLGLTAYDRRSGTIGGSFDESRTIVPDISIGDLHVRNAVFDELPITNNFPDVKVVGLLGFDFISNAVLAIDFKKQTLTFYPPGSALPSSGAPVTRMPIALDDGVPRVAASFNGIAGNFLIDTGSVPTILFQHYVQTVPDRWTVNASDYSIQYVGGDVVAQELQLKDFSFGPLEFAHIYVLEPESSKGELTDYDGIIGQTVLGYYVMYLDYANRQVYLQPND